MEKYGFLFVAPVAYNPKSEIFIPTVEPGKQRKSKPVLTGFLQYRAIIQIF